MNGKGRCLDNVFVERLWRTVKYEDIYLRNYESVPELTLGLGRYFPFYNEQRPHQRWATKHLGRFIVAAWRERAESREAAGAVGVRFRRHNSGVRWCGRSPPGCAPGGARHRRAVGRVIP